jgi:hypothetical protein
MDPPTLFERTDELDSRLAQVAGGLVLRDLGCGSRRPVPFGDLVVKVPGFRLELVERLTRITTLVQYGVVVALSHSNGTIVAPDE